jgi:hypothetical protein
MKIISVDEILVLTPEGDLIVFNSKGFEQCSLKNLLTKKQIEEGWKIRGLELCPEQTFVSVVSCRQIGSEKEYDRFLFIKIERAGAVK